MRADEPSKQETEKIEKTTESTQRETTKSERPSGGNAPAGGAEQGNRSSEGSKR